MAISHADVPVGRDLVSCRIAMTLTLPLWFASHGTEKHKETASPSWEAAKGTGLSQASIM